jgi:ATP-dependent DNA helicase RecG
LISENRSVTAAGMAAKLNLTPRSIEKQLASLKKMGMLERVGSRKVGYWRIKEE